MEHFGTKNDEIEQEKMTNILLHGNVGTDNNNSDKVDSKSEMERVGTINENEN